LIKAICMILKNQNEWALHCCALLAGLPPDKYLSTKAMAEFHDVPKEYLSKALQALSQAGLVESTLGPSGGYRLARKPSEITFLDIVEAVEGKGSTFVCTEIRKNNPCRPAKFCDNKPCAVARVMWEADAAWRKKLRSVRLSDLAQTLVEDVPADILKKSAAWVLART
jgi:Rrf2 family protein